MFTASERTLWGRWVAANTLAEMIGLGGSLAVGTLYFSALDSMGVAGAVAGAVLAVLMGTFLEGVLVGWMQWRVLRGPLPALRWQSWMLATAIGAGLAWVMGMTPSTIMVLAAPAPDPAAAAEAPQISAALTYLLAAALGLAAGPVLGGAQALLLRRYVRGAGWWAAANAAAWLVGMPLIFAGMDIAFAIPRALIVLVVLVTTAAAGAVVGAIHGAALVRLLRARR